MNDCGGYPIGSLVETTHDFEHAHGVRGVIIESWTPTVYDIRSYTVVLQTTGEKALFYANEIRIVRS